MKSHTHVRAPPSADPHPEGMIVWVRVPPLTLAAQLNAGKEKSHAHMHAQTSADSHPEGKRICMRVSF